MYVHHVSSHFIHCISSLFDYVHTSSSSLHPLGYASNVPFGSSVSYVYMLLEFEIKMIKSNQKIQCNDQDPSKCDQNGDLADFDQAQNPTHRSRPSTIGQISQTIYFKIEIK